MSNVKIDADTHYFVISSLHLYAVKTADDVILDYSNAIAPYLLKCSYVLWRLLTS